MNDVAEKINIALRNLAEMRNDIRTQVSAELQPQIDNLQRQLDDNRQQNAQILERIDTMQRYIESLELEIRRVRNILSLIVTFFQQMILGKMKLRTFCDVMVMESKFRNISYC